MMDKIITSDSQEALFQKLGRFVQVWESHRHIKSAASPLFSRQDLERHAPPAGKFLTHAVTLGNAEKFGQNRNFDAYPDEELQKSHGTFETHARVYREHNNKDPKKAIGEIKQAKYDPKLGWGECLFWTDIDKAASEYEAAKNGDEQHTSMACSIDHDRCDSCDHISKVSHDRCDCIRNSPGKFMRATQKFAHMINYGMTFKDQSWVGRPADRIAHTRDYIFAKAASAVRVLRGDELALAYLGNPWLDDLRKLHAHDAVSYDPMDKAASDYLWRNAVPEFDDELLTKMANHAWPSRVLRSLQKRAMVLPLASFEAFISNRSVAQAAADPIVKEASAKMATIRAIIIQRVGDEPEFSEGLSEAAQQFEPSNCGCDDLVDQMMEKAQDQFTCRYSLLAKRALYQEPRLELAPSSETPGAEALALGTLYNAYLLQQKQALQSNLEVRDATALLAALR